MSTEPLVAQAVDVEASPKPRYELVQVTRDFGAKLGEAAAQR